MRRNTILALIALGAALGLGLALLSDPSGDQNPDSLAGEHRSTPEDAGRPGNVSDPERAPAPTPPDDAPEPAADPVDPASLA